MPFCRDKDGKEVKDGKKKKKKDENGAENGSNEGDDDDDDDGDDDEDEVRSHLISRCRACSPLRQRTHLLKAALMALIGFRSIRHLVD